jgi:hypothetical protein
MSAPVVSVELPQEIADGLERGVYERLGGAIREVDTGQIVAFLREAYVLGEPIVSELLSLSTAPANANALNLALTTMQFAIVMSAWRPSRRISGERRSSWSPSATSSTSRSTPISGLPSISRPTASP